MLVEQWDALYANGDVDIRKHGNAIEHCGEIIPKKGPHFNPQIASEERGRERNRINISEAGGGSEGGCAI